MSDRNCISFWQPKLEAAGVPTPRTTIIRSEGDLSSLLDGQPPDGWDVFLTLMQAACYDHGLPCFLRTGHGSGKHDWLATCFVADAENVARNIFALVEWSHMADLLGLPHDVWAVRTMLETEHLFQCRGYNGFPVTREFRVFVRDDIVEHVQPYWPPDAVEQGEPDDADWLAKLRAISKLERDDAHDVPFLAGWASGAVGGGYWSVDVLQDRHGRWYVTDMAEGDRSFRWEP